jgi:YqaJ-like viral recombinase domain
LKKENISTNSIIPPFEQHKKKKETNMTTKDDDDVLEILILAVFPRSLYLSENQKTKVDTPLVKISKKVFRKHFPNKAKQIYLLRLEQGKPPWLEEREGQNGGSTASVYLGVNEYMNNQQLWEILSGRAPEKIMYQEDFFAICRGHVFEDFSFQLYRIVTGSLCFNAGMLLHSESPCFSISPDGISLQTSSSSLVPNIHCKKDKSYGMFEIKNPVYAAYVTKEGTALVKADYVPQLMLQMCHFQTTHDDFISTALANEQSPPVCVEEYYCPQAYDRKRKYLICDSLITRVYSNKEFAKQLMDIIKEQNAQLDKPDNYIYNVQQLLNDGKPLRFRMRDFEECWLYGSTVEEEQEQEPDMKDDDAIEEEERIIQWTRLSEIKDHFKIVSVPGRKEIHEIQFQNTMVSGKWQQLKLVFPPKLISEPPSSLPPISYLPLFRIRIFTTVSANIEPLSTEGEVRGEKSVSIERYTQNQPQKATIQELIKKQDNKKFIDAQTWEKETKERNQETFSTENVNNEVFRDIMKQHNMSLEESVKHFVLTYVAT